MSTSSAEHAGSLPAAAARSTMDEVLRTVRRRLDQAAYRDLRHVQAEFHEGVLTLRGKLPSFFLRQMAAATVTAVPGVEVLVDRMEVAPPRR